MKPTDERPNRLPWPPIILFCSLIGGLLLGVFMPVQFGSGVSADILQGLGLFALLAGVALLGFSIASMRKHKTTVHPNHAAAHLVTSGPFAISRNPIYLGNVVLLTGLGLLLRNPWMFLAALVCGYLTYRLAILREEAHLEHKFGKAWRNYRKKVRRWI